MSRLNIIKNVISSFGHELYIWLWHERDVLHQENDSLTRIIAFVKIAWKVQYDINRHKKGYY